MSEVTPPKPGEVKDGVKAGGKGLQAKLKKVPKWAWVAGAVVFVGVAYLTWKRAQSQPAVADTTATDQGFTDQALPGPTQGAFGGGSSPLDSGGALGSGLSFSDLFPDGMPITVTSIPPEPTSLTDDLIPTTPTQAVTGGGPPNRTAAAHVTPPENVVKNGKFYHVYNKGKGAKRGEKWVYLRPASNANKPNASAHHPTPSQHTPATHPGSPTGGGPPHGTAQVTAPKTVVKNKKVYHLYNEGRPDERWVYVRPASH